MQKVAVSTDVTAIAKARDLPWEIREILVDIVQGSWKNGPINREALQAFVTSNHTNAQRLSILKDFHKQLQATCRNDKLAQTSRNNTALLMKLSHDRVGLVLH